MKMCYLERSPMVQFMVQDYFRTILTREKDTIQKDIKEYNKSQESFNQEKKRKKNYWFVWEIV